VPARVAVGKGAIDCDDGTVYVWTVGGVEVLPEHLFDPNATVSPAVGFDPVRLAV
jgi:hypothetical protein